jgi:hypothetical protein
VLRDGVAVAEVKGHSCMLGRETALVVVAAQEEGLAVLATDCADSRRSAEGLQNEVEQAVWVDVGSKLAADSELLVED